MGFDPVARRFSTPIGPPITQDRLEQILDGYTRSAPVTRPS
jgi:hypothetical protein